MSFDDSLKEAMFYEKIGQKSVKCNLCAFRCEITNGSHGFCNIRKNVGGKLFSLVYGKPCAMVVDPIERRPFFHFYPGASVLTLATVGCNFKCKFCVNSEISQEKIIQEEFVTPEQVVNTALSYGVDGICFAYTEPTIFVEYLLDIARLAKRSGLFCSMITNGFMTSEAFEEIHPYLDAILVNFKASGASEQMANLASVKNTEPIFDFVKMVAEKRKHLEISDLIMPNHNEESFFRLCRWIGKEIGRNTPVHMLQFHPSFKLSDMQATSLEKMIRMKSYAKRFLDHVYFSNLPITENANTVCPACDKIVLKRAGFLTVENNLIGSHCMFCGHRIHGEFDHGQ